jgi:hypothetical protein
MLTAPAAPAGTDEGAPMAFENTKAEIDSLLRAVQEAPHDRYELYLTILQKLNELKAYGMPLPADLVELENRLDRELSAGRAEQHGGKGRRKH